MFVYVFLYLLYCVLFLWPQVYPLTPKSLAFAVWVSKLHHAGAKHVQRERETERKGRSWKGKKAPGPITAPRKQRAIFQWFLQLCCLWAVCLVSLWPSPPHLPSLRENKLKWPDAQSFISSCFSTISFFSSVGCWKHIAYLIQGSVNICYFTVFHVVALLVSPWHTIVPCMK